MGDPWERRPRETPRAFAAFTIYLGLGTTRSLAETAKKSQSTLGRIQNWSRTHKWASRAGAWEDRQAEIARAAHAKRLEDTRERIYSMGELAERKSMDALRNMDPKVFGPNVVPSMLKTAADLQITGLGGDIGDAPKQTVNVSVSGAGGGGIPAGGPRIALVFDDGYGQQLKEVMEDAGLEIPAPRFRRGRPESGLARTALAKLG